MSRLGISAVIFLVAMMFAMSAFALDYKGDVGGSSELRLTIANGAVTAIRGSATAHCQVGGDESVAFSLGAPVAVDEGRFHAEGATGDPVSGWKWSLDATVSSDGRKVSGSVTVSGGNASNTCSGTAPVTAIAVPLSVTLPLRRMFVPGAATGSTNPSVEFDYRKGLIMHLSARADTKCPSGASLGTTFSTTAYSLDPIHVTNGAFRIETDVLNDYDFITHVVLVGRVNGDKAFGTLDSQLDSPTFGRCVGHYVWTSHHPVPPASPKKTTSSQVAGARYTIGLFRYGHSHHWTYYFAVAADDCKGGVTSVNFRVVRGSSRTVRCGAPLRPHDLTPNKLAVKPKRTYRIVVTGIIERRGRIVRRASLGSVMKYMPGDGGCWRKKGQLPPAGCR